MIIKFGGEMDWHTKVDTISFKYSGDIEAFFNKKDYGSALKEIAIVLVCRPKGLNLKQRHRFDQKNGIFYVDIMLDYDLMVSADNQTMEIHFFDSFRQMLPFLEKKKIKEFKFEKFRADLEELLSEYI